MRNITAIRDPGRKLAAVLLVLALAALMCGCTGKNPEATEGTATTTAATEPTQDPVWSAMLERSIASTGNNHRLNAVIDKMRRGEDVTVGFIGGSITEGYNATGGKHYAKLLTDYLDSTYSDGTGKVSCLNAGLSGTPSTLGLIRAERDLLFANPDLIFIEFAVNDAQSFTDKQAYEALIRKCLLQENAPAVILLYSVTENGYTCQDNMALTAFFYDLPAMSVRDAIMPEIQSGNMTWDDWSDDEVHPHTQGHELYSRFIIHLMDTMLAEPVEEAYSVPEDPKFSRDWSNMQGFDSDNLEVLSMGDFEQSAAHFHFKNSYSYRGSAIGSNEGMTFEVTGTALFLVYKATTSSAYGTAEILVDGEVAAHLIACTPEGWNNPVAQLIYSDKEVGTHTITIRMQPGDEGKSFDLLYVGIVQE